MRPVKQGIGGTRSYKPVFSGVISPADIEAFNNAVTNWAKQVANQLKASAGSKTRDGKTAARMRKDVDGNTFKENILSRDVRFNIGRVDGEIERISFTFPRHGIFWQKGVSRGHGVGNPRTAFDWYNEIIERNISKLGDIAAEYYASAAVNATQILIQ